MMKYINIYNSRYLIYLFLQLLYACPLRFYFELQVIHLPQYLSDLGRIFILAYELVNLCCFFITKSCLLIVCLLSFLSEELAALVKSILSSFCDLSTYLALGFQLGFKLCDSEVFYLYLALKVLNFHNLVARPLNVI